MMYRIYTAYSEFKTNVYSKMPFGAYFYEIIQCCIATFFLHIGQQYFMIGRKHQISIGDSITLAIIKGLLFFQYLGHFFNIFTTSQMKFKFINQGMSMHGKVLFVLIVHVFIIINYFWQSRLKIKKYIFQHFKKITRVYNPTLITNTSDQTTKFFFSVAQIEKNTPYWSNLFSGTNFLSF